MGWKSAAAAVMLVVTPLVVAAQGGTAFEVASIRRNTSGEPGASLDMSRGAVRATNVPLQIIIRQAFDVMDSQIVGAPAWVTSDRYDIVAKAPDGIATAEAMRPLLRALLADRFKLTTHAEMRDLPVFNLVLARADRRFGPSLRPAPVDCVGVAQGHRRLRLPLPRRTSGPTAPSAPCQVCSMWAGTASGMSCGF